MDKLRLHGVTIECVQGDIAVQPDMDAVVNAANAELRTGGGVAGAIHRAAGPGLEAECRAFSPLRPGQAVITSAHGLPNRFVVHCLGPVFGRDEPADSLLATCYRNALYLAEQTEAIKSIAFPAISTGAFGYPKQPASEVALSTVVDELPQLSTIALVRFVLIDADHRRLYASLLARVADEEYGHRSIEVARR